MIKLICIFDNLTKKRNSQYTGVTKSNQKWAASIRYGKDKCYLGCFDTELEAHYAYKKALKEINEGVFVPPLKAKRFIKV